MTLPDEDVIFYLGKLRAHQPALQQGGNNDVAFSNQGVNHGKSNLEQEWRFG